MFRGYDSWKLSAPDDELGDWEAHVAEWAEDHFAECKCGRFVLEGETCSHCNEVNDDYGTCADWNDALRYADDELSARSSEPDYDPNDRYER